MSATDRRYATPRELRAVLGFEWRTRHAWRTRRAMLRGLWWSLVRRYPCEICEACGRPVGRSTGFSWWRAPDWLWRRVHGQYSGVLCIPCFTLEAEKVGIHLHWAPFVHHTTTRGGPA